MRTISTRKKINKEGEKVTPVFSTKIKDINGVNPADKLAATEYKTVQRKLIGTFQPTSQEQLHNMPLQVLQLLPDLRLIDKSYH